MARRRTAWMLAVLVLAAGAVMTRAQAPATDPLRAIAERYVRLVLAVGQHDADYVDAYYGPPEWRKEAESREGAAGRARPAGGRDRDGPRGVSGRRPRRRRMRSCGRCAGSTWPGSCRPFAPGWRCCRGRRSPSTRSRGRSTTRWRRRTPRPSSRRCWPSSRRSCPATGSLIERYDRYKQDFVIPARRLDRVFQEAIAPAASAR